MAEKEHLATFGPDRLRDGAAALQWLSLAHVNGSKRAEDYVKQLIARMDPVEVQAVRERMTAGDSAS